MRWINKIIVHCTANKATCKLKLQDFIKMHRERGFSTVGYHYIIFPDGRVEQGRPESRIGAHCQGQNYHSIGVAYVGGLDPHGKPADTRTPEQKKAMLELLTKLSAKYHCPIYGHRDFLRWYDKNSNGIRDNGECLKDCPCFNAHSEYSSLYQKG